MDNIDAKTIRTITLETIIVALLFLISVALFVFLTHQVVKGVDPWFDSKAFDFFRRHTTPSRVTFLRNISFLGSPLFLLPAYLLIIVWLAVKKRKYDAIDVTIVAVTATLLGRFLKWLIGRSRPDSPLFEAIGTNSFPSGHALSSFIFCSVVIWLLWKSEWSIAAKWILSLLLLSLSFTIGISRIVLRYHYASDVVAGFCIGFTWVMLSLWVQKRIRKSIGNRQYPIGNRQ
ncbi:MAG: phosphatase PAP2 family protein [Chitinophagaceae bacterium]|nr:phosphatase PAP2 family protein [Chitinophagaceae bacterium]